MTEQYNLGVEAEESFLLYQDMEECPPEMNTLGDNLLRSTKLDEELKQIDGDGVNVIPALELSCPRHFTRHDVVNTLSFEES